MSMSDIEIHVAYLNHQSEKVIKSVDCPDIVGVTDIQYLMFDYVQYNEFKTLKAGI